MKTMLHVGRRLWIEEHGAVLSSEVVLIGSLLVTGLVVGLTTLRDSVVTELADVASAIGALDQSYCFSGIVGHCGQTAGSAFRDRLDCVDTAVVAPCPRTQVCADVFPNVPLPPPPPPAPTCQCAPVNAVTTVVVNTQFVPGKCDQPAAVVSQPLSCGHAPALVNGLPVRGCQVVDCPGYARPGFGPGYGPGYGAGFPGGGLPEGTYTGSKIAFVPPANVVTSPVVPGVSHDGDSLSLVNTNDEELKKLSGLMNLKCLSLQGPGVTDAGLAQLVGLKNLVELHLLDAKVTDAGIEQLKALPQLRVLVLRNTQVSDEAAKKFATDRPNLQVVK